MNKNCPVCSVENADLADCKGQPSGITPLADLPWNGTTDIGAGSYYVEGDVEISGEVTVSGSTITIRDGASLTVTETGTLTMIGAHRDDEHDKGCCRQSWNHWENYGV